MTTDATPADAANHPDMQCAACGRWFRPHANGRSLPGHKTARGADAKSCWAGGLSPEYVLGVMARRAAAS